MRGLEKAILDFASFVWNVLCRQLLPTTPLLVIQSDQETVFGISGDG